jgi:hypothetical protein
VLYTPNNPSLLVKQAELECKKEQLHDLNCFIFELDKEVISHNDIVMRTILDEAVEFVLWTPNSQHR